MRFPLEDWQFWAATAVAAAGAWTILRPLMPRRRNTPACPGCPSGSSPKAQAEHAATLTIGGQPTTQASTRTRVPAEDPRAS